jgi:glycosyltransferase involved in cell wall biosynthesis
MNIDIIVKYFYPVAAGIETNILETYSVLVKRGHKVTVHTSRDNYLAKNSLPAKDVIRGIKVVRYPFASEIAGYMPKINWDKTDVVCLHNFNVSHFRILLKILLLKFQGKKKFSVLITPHGGFNPEWRVFDLKTRITKFLYQYTVGTILANLAGDGFRAVSVWEKVEMIKKGIKSKKIEVISNGLEDEAFVNVEKRASNKIKSQVKNYGKYILQIGRVYPIKNYETVIKALPLIDKNIKYVIIGQTQDPEYLNKLNNLAKTLGVEKRLIFAGIIRGVDKYYVIKKAKIMVHMAIWESFCNVVHEGLSQGTVCVVANNTALPLLIKNKINGYLVETHDYNNLARKINFILKNWNTVKIKKVQSNSKLFVKDFTWTKTALKLEGFIKHLTSK